MTDTDPARAAREALAAALVAGAGIALFQALLDAVSIAQFTGLQLGTGWNGSGVLLNLAGGAQATTALMLAGAVALVAWPGSGPRGRWTPKVLMAVALLGVTVVGLALLGVEEIIRLSYSDDGGFVSASSRGGGTEILAKVAAAAAYVPAAVIAGTAAVIARREDRR